MLSGWHKLSCFALLLFDNNSSRSRRFLGGRKKINSCAWLRVCVCVCVRVAQTVEKGVAVVRNVATTRKFILATFLSDQKPQSNNNNNSKNNFTYSETFELWHPNPAASPSSQIVLCCFNLFRLVCYLVLTRKAIWQMQTAAAEPNITHTTRAPPPFCRY